MKLSLNAFIFLNMIFFCLSSYGQVNPQALAKKVHASIVKVPEFKFIQEEAEKLGVKVYLFGGTAAAFAHYARWDLERESGDTKYQEERFDYDFTNIYRGNQDLDIVVDGTIAQANQLQALLKEKYPHFIGNKDAWEVRLLNEQKGDKLPLLDDFDFLNQHTDTNSTGMVALNALDAKLVFRDLFAWETEKSNFLKDVAAAKIKFLYSDTHEQTHRYKDGKNPPIFAAIRYLAKLTQYEVEGHPEDLKVIKDIIQKTNWSSISSNSYVRIKLEEFGKKVLLNAPNSEYAWDLLDSLGLREKLIEMDSNRPQNQDSLSWWMSKEPLRSHALGTQGKKAKDIFKDGEIILTHETNSFIAYENITRSSKGLANAFISRPNTPGEGAVHGEGFYTMSGKTGGRGTGLSIRFKLHPDAREGQDFSVHGGIVVVNNKNALSLIQENLNISIIDYLILLNSGELDQKDKGIREKFNRKFKRSPQDAKEFLEAIQFVQDSFVIAEDFPEDYIQASGVNTDFTNANFDELVTAYTQQRSAYFNTIVQIFIEKGAPKNLNPDWMATLIEGSNADAMIVEHILSKKPWHHHPELIMLLIKRGHTLGTIAEHVLSQKHWASQPKLVEALMEHGVNLEVLIEHVLSKEHWTQHPYFIEKLLETPRPHVDIAEHIMSQEHWKHREDWLELLVESGFSNKQLILYVFSQEHWFHRLDLIKKLLAKKELQQYIISHVFSHKYWTKHPELIEGLLKEPGAVPHIIEHVLSKEHWSHKAEWVDQILSPTRTGLFPFLISNVLNKPYWKTEDLERWIQIILDSEHSSHELVEHIFSQERWKDRKDWLKVIENKGLSSYILIPHVYSQLHWKEHASTKITSLLRDPALAQKIITHILSKEYWADRPDLIRFILKHHPDNSPNHSIDVHEHLAKYALNLPHWAAYPELVGELITQGTADKALAEKTLVGEHWTKHPELVERLIDEKKSAVHVSLAQYLFSQLHWMSHTNLLQKLIKKVRKTGKHSQLASTLTPNVFGSKDWSGPIELAEEFYFKLNAEAQEFFVEKALQNDYWLDHPGFLEKILETSPKNVDLKILYVFRKNIAWAQHPHLVEKIIEKGELNPQIAALIFKDEHWAVHKHLIHKLIDTKHQGTHRTLASDVFSKEYWVQYPEYVEKMIKNCTENLRCHHIIYILRAPHWGKHPYLVDMLMQNPVAHHNIAFSLLIDLHKSFSTIA